MSFPNTETLRTMESATAVSLKSGSKDRLKREKPFYNIYKFRVNVAVRATDPTPLRMKEAVATRFRKRTERNMKLLY